jgi:DNA helicase II / ATP-dependent DNA helicase PcrA
MDLLQNLNPPQKEAVLHDEGPLLVLAGAGSGKTRVIAHRIAYLIQCREVPPSQILAVTFTSKAAGELRVRVQQTVGEGELPLISTFHSTCAKILRSEICHLGFKGNFAIYDDKDCERLFKECAADLNLNEKSYPARTLNSAIDDFKNSGLAPDQVPSRSPYDATLARVYTLYQERLKRCNALDFGDLLLLTVRLFVEHHDVLEKYQQRYRWILVDEYQDTNPVQYQLVRLLAGSTQNLCVVGDDDQSIYGWRGADIRNILEFEKDFTGVKVVKLEQNYRSTKTILAAAWNVVEKNRSRKPKKLWTENPDGEPIMYHRLLNERDEAHLVCKETERFISGGGDLSDVAVLYRTNAQSRVVEDAMMAAGIPYHMVGGVRFFARLEVKDILAYLKVLDNPSDDVAVKRIINTPPRGIGHTTVERISLFASDKGIPFYDAMLEAAKGTILASAARSKLVAFADEIQGYRDLPETLPLAELAAAIMRDSGYILRLTEQKSAEAQDRLANLQELITVMQTFDNGTGKNNLAAFLEHVALVSDLEQGEAKKSSVRLMTLHSAKGLEFSLVFMIGMEEGLFPHSRSLDERVQMEEERRLCYVGMTRAKKKLYLLNVHRRHIFGHEQTNPPARFIADIPAELIDASDVRHKPLATQTASSFNLPRLTDEEIDLDFAKVKVVHEDQGDQVCLGKRICHAQFGPGIIRKIDETGDNQIVLVWFNSVGPKKLQMPFVGTEAE